MAQKNGHFGVEKQMTVTITCDHRHIYGADAAEFLRDLVTREVVSVEHISGAVMLADILTKAASRGVFVDLIKQLDSFA